MTQSLGTVERVIRIVVGVVVLALTQMPHAVLHCATRGVHRVISFKVD